MKAKQNADAASPSLSDRSQSLVYLPHQADESSVEEVLSVSYYAWLLRKSKWKIACVVFLCTTVTAIYCITVKPVYEATARITIDPRIPSAVVGQQAEPEGASDVDQIINTEIQIVQSDGVLRPVAEQFNLLAGIDTDGAQAKASRGFFQRLKSSIVRETTDRPLSDAPVSLGNLVVDHPANSLLIDISYRSGDPRQAALVANAVAQSYITRGMEMRARSSMSLSAFMEKQIAELKKNMDDSSLALAGYEQRLGVIDPDEKTSMVASHLLQLETEYTNAQNDRILKETEYSALESGATNSLSAAALEVSPQAALLTRQEEQVRAAQEKLAVAKTIYGPNYAEYKRAANDLTEVTNQYQQMRSEVGTRIKVAYQEALNRERLLNESLMAAKSESDKINANSAQYEELKREAEANKNLYDELFRKIKEAGVNAGFQGSSIRVANEARPAIRPVFPKKGLFVAIAFTLSSLGSVLVVILADMLDTTLRDPEQTRRFTGCEVLGTLPRVSRFLKTKGGTALEGRDKAKDYFETEEFYRESIAILLNSILHPRSNARPHSILITSAGPGEGKSTCAAHLAMAHANLGKRTLLIDADLRRPFQQTFFKLPYDVGLGESIKSNLPLAEIRQMVEGFSSLDVIASGHASRNTIGHLGLRVADLLQQAANDYDLVIVDAPPMVGLSDPVAIASWSDGVLIIGHAARTSRQAIASVVSSLLRVDAKILGVVLNHVQLDTSQSYGHYAAYASYADRLVG